MGAFPHFGGRWSEWNGRYRDTVRSFVKGSDGPWVGAFASAICGSPNIYGRQEVRVIDYDYNAIGRGVMTSPVTTRALGTVEPRTDGRDVPADWAWDYRGRGW